MLGTGIASADEDVNPDKPASPLDGSVTVPVHLDNNVFGTPLGQKAVPAVRRDVTVGTAQITRALPAAPAARVTDPVVGGVTGAVAPVVGKARGAVAPLREEGRDFAAPLAAKAEPLVDEVGTLPGGDKLPPVPSLDRVHVPAVEKVDGTPGQDNQLNVDLVVPVDVSGNAVAVLGRAETTNGSAQSYGTDHDVTADGSQSFVGGNVVDLDWALPVQITNNAVAGLGKASAEGCGSQEAWATGDIVTSGRHSALGGNVVAPQLATPVQVDGNAVAGGGGAQAVSYTDTTAESGGSVLTTGMDGVGSGNAVPVPAAVPARVNGNALTGLGDAQAWSESTADATAGETRTGTYNVPTYVETNGDPALAAGNIVHPAVSGPAMLCGNAAAAAGEADSVCDTATGTEAGGTNRTTGTGSAVSGAVADAPVVLPVQGFGNAVAGLGEATAVSDNAVRSTAGGDSYTRGHDSVASGIVAKAPVTGTGDVFANSVAAAGYAGSAAENDVVVHSGGNAGTTGDDSLVGGNMVATPLVAPAEVYGNAAAGGGAAESAASETKTTTSGSGRNTDDDWGVLASNLVTVPVATAAQVFGNGAGALAVTDARASAIEEFSAGGDNRATGIAGLGSGNIGQVPVAVPFQVFGTGVSGLGKGTQAAVNETEMEAGGDSVSSGTRGTLAGNVVTAPIAGAGQVFGDSVAALGRNRSMAGSETETEAGGDTTTSGRDGLVAGNVLAPQALPIAQAFAVAASGVGGVDSAWAANQVASESGGDIDTTGDEGYLSGNLVDVPAAAVVQPFGDAVAAVTSRSYAQGVSGTTGEVGGTSTTSGEPGSLSGIDGTLPIGADVPVYDVPVEVLAQAMTESANNSDVQVGEGEAQMLRLPAEGAMSATELPSFSARRFSAQRSAPTEGFQGAFTGVLTGFPTRMPILPVQDRVTGLAEGELEDGLAEVPQTLPAPARADAAPVPGLPGGLPVALPGLPAQLPGLPADVPTPIDTLSAGLPTSVPGVPSGSLNGTEVDLPNGGLPTEAPALPTDAIKGGLPSDVPGLPAGVVPSGLVNQNLPTYRLTMDLPTDGITGDLPVSDLPIGLPAQQRALPTGGVGSDLPVGGLPVDLPARRDLPTDGIVGGLPVSDLAVGLPARQRALPTGGVGSDLPVGGLPVDLPARQDLPTDGIVGGLPVQRDLPTDSVLGGLPVSGLPVGLPAQRDLPTDSVTGGLPVGDLPVALPVRRDLPTDTVVGGLPIGDLPLGDLPIGDLPIGELPVGGLPIGNLPIDLPVALPVQRDLPTETITGLLPIGDLPVGDLPIGDLPIGNLPIDLPVALPVQRDLPTDTITGGLPIGDLPVGDLPIGGLPIGNLPIDLPVALPVQRDLPTDTIVGDLPLGDLPIGELPVGGLPIGNLPIDLPVRRELPHIPTMPMAGNVFAPLSSASLDRFGGFGSRSNVPQNLTEVTTLIPVIPASGDLTDITAVLPVIPAAPAFGDITAAPVVQAPAIGTLPVPAVDGAAAPELDGSSLDSTRAALANLFTTRPIG